MRSNREYIECINKIEQEDSKQQNDAHLAETGVTHGWNTKSQLSLLPPQMNKEAHAR